MTPQETKRCIDVLARGIDPTSGAPLPKDSPFNKPDAIRALFVAGQALELTIAKSGV